jgi:uncharacterized repeat protein (TIGR01451 family)
MVRSRVVGFALLMSLAGMPSVEAHLATGPFQPAQVFSQSPATDGITFTLPNGHQHPVPAALQPTAGFSFQTDNALLLSRRAVAGAGCTGGTQVSLHRIPVTNGDPLEAVMVDRCLSDGLAWTAKFSGQPAGSPQQIVALIENSPATATTQAITWVEAATGTVSRSVHRRQIEQTTLTFGRSGTVALVHHELGGASGTSDWAVVDLCPGSVGTVLTNLQDLGAGASGEVVLVGSNPNQYVARISDTDLISGAVDVALVDCVNPPPPPPDRHRLSVGFAGDGDGTIQDFSFQILCSSTGSPNWCFADFQDGATVSLTASGALGSQFLGWQGDCSGASTFTSITLAADATCTAVFDAIQVDVGVTGAAAPDPVVAGDPLQTTWTVSNAGPDPATSVAVDVTVPSEFAFDAAASSPGCAANGAGRVTCAAGGLAPGATMPVVVVGTIAPDHRSGVALSAEVSAQELDTNAANDIATVSAAVVAHVDLAVTKTVSRTDPAPGDLVAYEVEVRNDGRSTALGVELLDALPPGFTLLEDPVTTSLQCGLGVLAPGASAVVTLIGRVDPGASVGWPLDNTASVSSLDADVNPGNESDGASATVGPSQPGNPAGIRRLVAYGDPVPGSTEVFSDFGAPALADDLVAFTSQPFAGSLHGLYAAFLTGDVVRLADTTAVPPGGNGQFGLHGFTDPSVEGNTVASTAITGPSGQLIFRTSTCGLESVFGPTFDGIFPPTLGGGSLVGFRSPFAAGDNGYYRWDDAGMHLMLSTEEPMPGSGQAFYHLVDAPGWDGQRLVFWGGADGIATPAWQGVYVLDGGLTTVADISTVLPGHSQAIVAFKWGIAVGGDMAAFVAHLADGTEAMVAADLATGDLTVLADSTTILPGRTTPMDRFGDGGWAAGPDRVVFTAFSTTDFTSGLYVWDGNQVQPVAVQGDPFDGATFGTAEFGPESLNGRYLAAEVGLIGGVGGLYLIDLDAVTPLFTDGFEQGNLSGWSATSP